MQRKTKADWILVVILVFVLAAALRITFGPPIGITTGAIYVDNHTRSRDGIPTILTTATPNPDPWWK